MKSARIKPELFRDRRDAGRLLAEKLAAYASRPDVLVLALPRGGVPVAYEVARALGAPLDVFVVRKLGVPGYEELAMGAVATGGGRVVNKEIVDRLGIPDHLIDAVAAREMQELMRREGLYRDGRPPPDVRGRTVLLGEACHGTHEFYRERAEITKRLIRERSFVAVAVEADWPDAYRVNRYVRRVSDDVDAFEALIDFRRFPTWMWRNKVVVDFIE